MRARILMVDDETSLSATIIDFLAEKGYAAESAPDAVEALKSLQRRSPDLVLLDLNLGEESGLDLLESMREQGFDQPVIIVSAFGTFDNSVHAMRLGAVDFLRKPFGLHEMEARVRFALEGSRRQRELEYLRGDSELLRENHQLIGDHDSFQQLTEGVERMARLVAELNPVDRPPLLITGETGTGKNVIARELHERADGGGTPFIQVNCTSVQATLFEAELFGHERGAFTGAERTRQGLFETAGGGTLFLDEIGDLPLELQSKLLTAIEEKTIRRVGSSDERKVEVWVVAATNADLEKLVADGAFRADLYYRIGTFHLHVPALRDRGNDVVALASHFLEIAARKYRLPIPVLSDSACEALMRYPWPGNLRELRNLMERAAVRATGDEITAELLTKAEPALADHSPPSDPDRSRTGFAHPLVCLPEEGVPFETIERAALREALERTGGNVSRAARLLHLTRERFRSRWKRTATTDSQADSASSGTSRPGS